MELKDCCLNPFSVVIDAALLLAESNPACRGCGDYTFLKRVIIHKISDVPILSLEKKQDEWLVQNLKRTLYKTLNSEQKLCERCEELPIFKEKLFKKEELIVVAAKAGKKFGQEEGGCTGCGRFDDERRMGEMIVPEIHPFTPLLALEDYQGGKLLPKLREAFIKAYHAHAPQQCGNCCSD